jgi:hypothetical protein
MGDTMKDSVIYRSILCISVYVPVSMAYNVVKTCRAAGDKLLKNFLHDHYVLFLQLLRNCAIFHAFGLTVPYYHTYNSSSSVTQPSCDEELLRQPLTKILILSSRVVDNF